MAFHREYPRICPSDPDPARAAVAGQLPPGRRRWATPLSRSARLAALTMAAAVTACDPYVQGNGVYLELERMPGPFAGLHVDDAIAATATVSEGAAHAVHVSGDANLLEHVKTQVRTLDVRGVSVDVLHVWIEEPSGGYSPTIPIRASVVLPALRFLGAIGAARLEAIGVAAQELDVTAAGGGTLEASGPGGAALYAVVDGARVDLDGYPVATRVDLRVTGRSTVGVSASGTLAGEARGAGTVVTNAATAAVCELATSEGATGPCSPPP